MTPEKAERDRQLALAIEHGEQRAILCGMPVTLLEDGGCTPSNWLSGLLLDFMLSCFGFNGAVLCYAEGEGYWRTLWRWMTEDLE